MLSSLITLVCGEGLGVRLPCRRAEDGLKGHFRFSYEHAKESLAVFDSPLVTGMFLKEFGGRSV